MKGVLKLFCLFITANVFAQQGYVDWCYCTGTKPGLHLGGQTGYAWMKTPTKNNRLKPNDIPIITKRGHFAWGVYVGYNWCTWFRPNIYLGLEAACNDNGYSTLHYQTSSNEYRFRCRDWSVVATASYIILNQFDLFFKLGPARMRETYQLQGKWDRNMWDPPSVAYSWAPTLTAGIGWSIVNYVKLSFQYRGVFSTDQSTFTRAFNERSKLRSVATVNSLLGGLEFIF